MQCSCNIDFSALKQQALATIDSTFEQIDEFLPAGSDHIHSIQGGLDQIGRALEGILSPLSAVNDFINSNSAKNLIEQLTIELAKLPLKVARNILVTLYTVVREIMVAAVHPMDAARRLTKTLVEFVAALANPTTWTVVGTGMVAGALGQAMIPGQVLAPIMVIIGSSLIGLGLTFETIRAIFNAETEDDFFSYVAGELLKTLKMLPEVAATGFTVGTIIGSLLPAQPTQQQIDALGRKFARDYNWAFGPDHWQTYELDNLGQVVVQKHYYWWTHGGRVVPTESSLLAPGRYVLQVPSRIPVALPTRAMYQTSRV